MFLFSYDGLPFLSVVLSLYEYPAVDDAPAENQLCEIPGRDIIPVFEDEIG